MSLTFKIFCPSCGHRFEYLPKFKGKVVGGISGIISGAVLGAKIGIAGGPLGAIAGTILGAILGGLFGKDFGNKFDKPKCPSCKVVFDIPSKFKKAYLSELIKIGNSANSKSKKKMILPK